MADISEKLRLLPRRIARCKPGDHAWDDSDKEPEAWLAVIEESADLSDKETYPDEIDGEKVIYRLTGRPELQ